MKYIKYKLQCKNCGEEMIHTNADFTQDDSNIVRIDLEFSVDGLSFDCPNCGTEHYVSLFTDYEVNEDYQNDNDEEDDDFEEEYDEEEYDTHYDDEDNYEEDEDY